MRLAIIFLLTTLMTELSYGQMDSTPVGIYKTPDVGLWVRVLLVYNDSTYEFNLITDRGRYPREPESGKRPNWTYDSTAAKILLKSTEEYKPKINTYSIQSNGDLIDKKGKLWKKIADLDSAGQLIRFVDNDGRIFKYNQKGHLEFSEMYEDNKLIDKEIYYGLDSTDSLAAKNLQIETRNRYQNPYLFYSSLNSHMAYSFGAIEKKEELVDGKLIVSYFDREGNPTNKH